MAKRKHKPIKEITLNLVQLFFINAPQKQKYLEGGRGLGKSVILGHEIQDVAHQLPRSKNVLVGATYKDILTTTLPSTKNGLELFGYYEGVHYVIGRRHPEWPVCYDAPSGREAWKHFMHWYTGACWKFVSQDRDGSGRGENSFTVQGDEACNLNYQKLQTDVLLTNRAGRNFFPGHPKLNSETFLSTIPLHAEGKWFLNMREAAAEEPDKILHLRGSTKFNRHNLAPDYFERLKRSLLTHVYNAEVLNIRPQKVANGFYPTLNSEKHYYTKFNYDFYDIENNRFKPTSFTCEGDDDHDTKREMLVAIDWGGRINSMAVAQQHTGEVRFIKDFYVLHPQIIDDLVNDFCRYYSTHQRKTVRLYYDHSGNSRTANSKLTFAEQAKSAFTKNGWTVILMSKSGSEALHKDKFAIIAMALKGDNLRLPAIKINKHNCKHMVISMENAGAIDDRNGEVKKDKSSERSKIIPAEEATHLSDTFDMIVYPIFKPLMKSRGEFVDFLTI